MLLPLGDASLIFGSDSVVDMDDWDYIFDDGWSDVWFSNLLHIWFHTRAYSVLIRIYRSSLISMIIPTYEIHVELMICFCFIMIPNRASLWPFGQAHTFWYLDVIMFLPLGDASLIFGSNSVVDMDDWDYTFDDVWSDVWFSDLPHIRCHIGAYSVLVEIYRFSLIRMIIPTYEIHVKLMICFCFIVIP